jgi:Na+/proline symporter
VCWLTITVKEILEKIDRAKTLSSEEQAVGARLDERGVRHSRHAMLVITVAGMLVALAANYIPGFGLKHLWWIFNTVDACVVVPTILSLYWSKLDARGVFLGVLSAFVVGLPLFVYGNIIDKPMWIVGSSLFIIAISIGFCLALRKKDS